MKHSHTQLGRSALVTALAELGLSLQESRIELLLRHLELVLQANREVNLTAITDFESAVRLHIADSLTAVPEVDAAPCGPVLDIGSGAGYPGIPIAIATSRHVDLLESIAKKASFLAYAVQELGLDAHVKNMRAEELAASCRETYAVVLARAVADLPVLVELAAPLLLMGGHLVALKGDMKADEAERGSAAARLVGLELLSERRLALPVSGDRRTLAVFEKVKETPARYPRRTGMAQKKPLA